MGKIATVLQMIVVIWILLGWDRDLNARWLKSGRSVRRSAPVCRAAVRLGWRKTARGASGQLADKN